MFDTERNQPMRACATASGFSARKFGIANGVLTRPMPSSNGSSCFGSGAKIEPMVGAALRCSQATGLPPVVEAGLDPLDRDGVVVAVVQVVLAGPGDLHGRAVHRLAEQPGLDHEVGLRLAAEAAAEERHVDGDVLLA